MLSIYPLACGDYSRRGKETFEEDSVVVLQVNLWIRTSSDMRESKNKSKCRMKTSTVGRTLGRVSSSPLLSSPWGPNKDISKLFSSVSTTCVMAADMGVSVRKSPKHEENLLSSSAFAGLSIYLQTVGWRATPGDGKGIRELSAKDFKLEYYSYWFFCIILKKKKSQVHPKYFILLSVRPEST